MIELNIVEASWSMGASGSWLKLKPEFPAQAQMVAGEFDPQKKYTVTIKEFRKKRSLDANAYAWVLMNKLADKLNMGVRDLYRHYIPDIPENSQVVCVPTEAVEKLQSGWAHNGIGWCSDTLKSKLPGCTNVVLYYGSSTFDQKQMGVLLDLIIEDCKQVGVEYLTPEELERLKGEWDA
nr:MAG TPA: NinB protein [Caudoviricetes sp.]